MKIELLGALDEKKVKQELKAEDSLEKLKNLQTARRCEIVSSAGRLSRFAGDVFEVLGLSEEKTLEQNIKFAQRVIGYGHSSIADHDYCVFAIKDVTPIIEQIIIAERFASFTIKSRREVDFSQVGFYTPNFYDNAGQKIGKENQALREYQQYMKNLFQQYSVLTNQNISKEDARFILPYCYYSNILMGVDAHTLRDMIIKFTKTKYAEIGEVKEFGQKLYEIAKEKIPYIIETIDKTEENLTDEVAQYLNQTTKQEEYEILDKPKLLMATPKIDDTILIGSLMRRYQYSYDKAKKIYDEACHTNENFKEQLMRKIAFESDKLELTQVNFQFQIPLSFAVLTHLTRHRTHQIMIPDFVPNVDLMQYKTPPKIKILQNDYYQKIYQQNQKMYKHFKEDYQIREEDLIYFTLSGNMVNVVTNMDGKTVEHILRLRECSKAQWETRDMAKGMHEEISKLEDAQYFSRILGSTCMTQGICHEGKECCGKVYTLQKKFLQK